MTLRYLVCNIHIIQRSIISHLETKSSKEKTIKFSYSNENSSFYLHQNILA